MHSTFQAKAELRKIIKQKLSAISAGQFSAAGSYAAQQLHRIPCWGSFKSILAFSSMKDEMETQPIIETIEAAGKTVFIPQINGEDLVFCRIEKGGSNSDSGKPGSSRRALTLLPRDFPVLVLTPGLAFDRNLNRLGRGRSYYDRFFAGLDAAQRDFTAAGLCMDCQLVEEVPADYWDKKVDMLITESAIIFPS